MTIYALCTTKMASAQGAATNVDEPYGRGDGIAITSITFHEKEGGTTEPSDPSEPSTPSDPSDPSDETPPETGDAHIIFAVAAAGIALTVLIRKKVTV